MTTDTLDKKITAAKTAQVLSLTQIGCLVLSLVMVIAVAWCRVAVINAEYKISTLEASVRKISGNLQTLQIEVSSLRQPQRIARIARNELGLVVSDPNRVITVQDNRSTNTEISVVGNVVENGYKK